MASKPHTVLFIDWSHITSGQVSPQLDPAQISDRGRWELEKYDRIYGIRFDQSGHGLKRCRLPFGVQIRVEKARKSEPWLVSDQPWEGVLASGVVLQEEGLYRCWYNTIRRKETEVVFAGSRAMEVAKVPLHYAESSDGYTWIKPSLGVVDYRGSRDNNLVCPSANAAAVFRDEGAPADQRYKSFWFDALRDVPEDTPPFRAYGLFGLVSPDGLRWRPWPDHPLIRYFCDTQNIACWDEQAGEYVGYFRSHTHGRRSISSAATRDWTAWPHPETILAPGPEDGPAEDYYTNGFTRYPGDPSQRLLFAAIYHHNSDGVDVRLASGVNRTAFNWVSRDPIIPVGAPGEWDSASIYAQPDLMYLPNGRLALSYLGNNVTHEEEYFTMFYERYAKDVRGAFAWALWEEGRLAGVEADDYGEFFTREPELLEGGAIEINARTSGAGSVAVELWDAATDRPVEGFAFADGEPFSGNEIWRRCRWKNDLSQHSGRPVQLHFRLSNAKVFGYRFV